MTITELVAKGIYRFRRPCWANPNAYAKVDKIVAGTWTGIAPWLHLFDRKVQKVLRQPTPQSTLLALERGEDFVAYDGPLDEADKEG